MRVSCWGSCWGSWCVGRVGFEEKAGVRLAFDWACMAWACMAWAG